MGPAFSFRALAPMLATAAALLSAAATPAATTPVASVPYVWRNVAIRGGGFVTGIVAHPGEPGLLYARTDVGGAYRWDATGRRWVPLTDWIGERDWNLMGIESLAIDPSDPNRLYLAAGTYDRFPAAILRSDDQGRTFQRTNAPFAMGANEAGRFAGERLAVDPNDGHVLFFGSRRDGLWRSADRGVTWHRVAGFPRHPRPEFQPVGIVAVVFDPASGRPGAPTPVLYAAVSTTGTNLYRSTDAGWTWAQVAGQPVGLRPNHLVASPDGALYLSYSREPGPAGPMSDGAVWKYLPQTGTWTDITPEKPAQAGQGFGYGCVAVDPRHPATVMATTFSRWKPHDQIYRSTNAGATWRKLWTGGAARWDHTAAPYTATRHPHWLGTLVIDPFNANRVLFTTGYGIWASTDATAADAGRPTHWEFLDRGLEETVPLALISPPTGAHLVSGLGDIDGFRHDTLDESPTAGSFAGPRFASTRDLAFAALHPNLMARIGNAGPTVFVHVAESTDGGRTWQALAGDPPGGADGMGRIALTADGTVLVWATSSGAAYRTKDHGRSWTRCIGIAATAALAADPVDPRRLYGLDAAAGRLLISADAGRTFQPASARGLTLPRQAGGGVALAVAPDRAGDVWIGSRGGGLFHSTDAGATFARIAAVEDTEAVGFGKAAPGTSYPAIYLRGGIDGRAAFYRSTDGGVSWVRINDDAHQYGGANQPLIIGDPRIFGRVYLTTGGRGIIYGDPAGKPAGAGEN